MRLWRAMTLAFLDGLVDSEGNAWAAAEQPLTVEQLVEVAIEVNPQVRATKEQWDAAQHQILQNYAPADPIFTYANAGQQQRFQRGGTTATRSAKISSFREKRCYRRMKQSGPPRLRV